jgi:hypothetical protein
MFVGFVVAGVKWGGWRASGFVSFKVDEESAALAYSSSLLPSSTSFSRVQTSYSDDFVEVWVVRVTAVTMIVGVSVFSGGKVLFFGFLVFVDITRALLAKRPV